ncbi:MAG: P-II family nitrogen regulator [Planctomycetes bacterium]|nr:P-II family nitrogen regulator [Planctomycetota bacterium]
MKYVTAFIPPDRLEAVKEALGAVEVFRLTVSDAQALGRTPPGGASPGAESIFRLAPQARLEIAVNEAFVEPTVSAIARAGLADGDDREGRIFVLELADAVRIRTGERGPEAI